MSNKDTIYRQAAIDAFGELDIELRPSAIDAITDMLKKLPPVQPEQWWIPCSKQLPKKVDNYLVTTHSEQIARYIYTGTDSSKEYWMRCVAAWMPLPKPWKGETNETG